MDELLNDYDDLIDVAVSKTISNKSVKISSVCPREDSYTLERTDAFNAGLSVLCRDKGCTFIDNDGNFRTRDGSISACVLSDDGVHLTKVGSDLLSRNLSTPTVTRLQLHIQYFTAITPGHWACSCTISTPLWSIQHCNHFGARYFSYILPSMS